MRLPNGNGFYIWILDRCSKGDPVAIAENAKRAGLGWVALKIADGIYQYNDLAKLRATVEQLRKVNIGVWGWHYIYGYPEGEVSIAARQMHELGLDGYIIDAEVEFKRPGMDTVAKKFMNLLREKLSCPIGLTSYRFPTLHREFPWKSFLPLVHFNQPQVYWIGAHNAGYQLRRSVQEFDDLYKSLGMAKIPSIPLGAAFTESGWNPTPAEILEFRKTAVDLGLPGYGWWEWYFAETRNPVWWNAATENVITGETPPPPVTEPEKPEVHQPVKRLVATSYRDLRVRSGPSTSHTVLGYMTPYLAYGVTEQVGEWGRLADQPKETWVHLGYTQNVKRVVTHYSNLRVRQGASLSAPILGYLSQNVPHLIVAERGAWGRLEGAAERWVYMDYVTEL